MKNCVVLRINFLFNAFFTSRCETVLNSRLARFREKTKLSQQSVNEASVRKIFYWKKLPINNRRQSKRWKCACVVQCFDASLEWTLKMWFKCWIGLERCRWFYLHLKKLYIVLPFHIFGQHEGTWEVLATKTNVDISRSKNNIGNYHQTYYLISVHSMVIKG